MFTESDNVTNNNALILNLEKMINDLKIEYESYFMGFRDKTGKTKREPLALKKKVEQIIRDMSNRSLGNAAYNFRFNQIVARFNTFNQYWMRVVRKIEDGSYERDRFKLMLKEKGAEPLSSAKESAEEPETPVAALKDDAYKQLYNELIEAKRKCNEQTDALQYDKFKQLIQKQTETLKSEYKCKKVEFQVAIENGKTKIKAIPK